jgi:DNA polymerase III epsilon subunit-like protein
MYLAIDCETTGLTENCNVLTVCYLLLDDDLIEIDILNQNIKHDFYNLYLKALDINKINLKENEKTALTVSESKLQFEMFLQKHTLKNKLTIIGHNVEFDINMLKNNQLLSIDIYNNYFNSSYLDTKKLAGVLKSANKIPSNISLSLINLIKYFNIDEENSNFHNAEYDIRMTLKLLHKLKTIK